MNTVKKLICQKGQVPQQLAGSATDGREIGCRVIQLLKEEGQSWTFNDKTSTEMEW